MPLASDIRLPERYRVTRHIASGGMASVWEVEDLLLRRVVAVKLLGAQYAADRGARERFQREARTAARVSDHPHIATIYDIGEHGEDAFIVMEYFSGGTVADRLRAAAAGGERVPRETALRWLREAAAGLDSAHAAGVVHRDVKPANLLLDARDRLAVGDFGIARLADDTPMTQTGQLLGTAAYLSPEQALGRSATAASDRYALAVVAYELLTGTRPFPGGPPAAQLRQHVETRPARPSETDSGLPRPLDAVLERALAKEPAERPATAGELVDQIERALSGPERTERMRPVAAIAPAPPPAARTPEAAPAPPPPRRPQPPQPAPDGGRRRLSPLAALGLVAALAGVVVAIALASAGDGGRETATSTPRQTQAPRDRSETQAAAPATPPADGESAQTAAPPAGQDPEALNEQGFQLNQAGNYAAAVEPLRASVEGYREAGRRDEIGYAYALYNLGVALNRSGNPEAAIPVLEERLQYNNQRGVVRQELADAQSKLGGDEKKGRGEDKDDD